MSMEEFGKDLAGKEENTKAAAATPTPPLLATVVNDGLQQWTAHGDCYKAVGKTQAKLPAGSYLLGENNQGEILFTRREIVVDELLEFPDSVSAAILQEIDDFWAKGSLFKEYKFLHRRGYLLYGPAGGGKTCIVQSVIHRIISAGDIVLSGQIPWLLTRALVVLRTVEPRRRVVCVYEDIDAILKERGEESLLAVLDGENQIDKVLNIATTNYPERLDKRLVARPRRFDRVIKIGMPGAAVRELYLKKKLGIGNPELDKWVTHTEGFSFASLAELVISVKCLGNDFSQVVKILSEMQTKKVSSGEFDAIPVGGFKANGEKILSN